jgi:hypothetical protein
MLLPAFHCTLPKFQEFSTPSIKVPSILTKRPVPGKEPAIYFFLHPE